MRDVTALNKSREHRKRLEHQLHQAQKMEAIGRLAGGVAHDFNNLLSVILGYGEMVLEELEAEHPHRPSLEEIQASALRAKDLTRQLLAFSRKQILEMKTVDLNTVVLGFEKLLRRLIGERYRPAFVADAGTTHCDGGHQPDGTSADEPGGKCTRCHAQWGQPVP